MMDEYIHHDLSHTLFCKLCKIEGMSPQSAQGSAASMMLLKIVSWDVQFPVYTPHVSIESQTIPKLEWTHKNQWA